MPALISLFLCVIASMSGISHAQEVATAFRYPVTESGSATGINYTVSREYQYSISSGKHDGTDFDYACGDSIYAVANGVVVVSQEYGEDTDYDGISDTSWGELIRIKHVMQDGTIRYSQYAHLQSRFVAVGDEVSYGEHIGDMGTTGNSTGCHLHFQIITQNSGGCGYYKSGTSCGNLWASEDAYWNTFLDPIDFLDENLGEQKETCRTEPDADMVPINFVYMHPDDKKFDFHAYYTNDSDDRWGNMTLLNREDIDAVSLAHPIIDNEGSVNHKEMWLNGDVNGNGYDDMVLITHPESGVFKAFVWESAGDWSDGTTLESKVKWKQYSGGQADLYFLGDADGDGRDDLIFATDDGNETVEWTYCTANPSDSFGTCTEWSSDFGRSVEEDIFLVADYDGDGQDDVIRGYTTGDVTTSCTTGGTQLRWRVMYGGGSSSTIVNSSGWGCANSTYLAAEVTSDNAADIIQIRHDTETKAPVFVGVSTNSGTSMSTSRWRKDHGSSNHTYFAADMDDDGLSDLIAYKRGGKDRIRVLFSNGSNAFGVGEYPNRFMQGVRRKRNGTFRFGHFGDLNLSIGEEQVCTSRSRSASMALNLNDFTPVMADGGNTIYLHRDRELLPFGGWNAYTACGFGAGDALTVTSGSLSTLPVGDTITSTSWCGGLASGDLVKGSGSTVYLIADGLKWAVASATVFEECFGSEGWDEIIEVDNSVLTGFGNGTTISDPTQCGVGLNSDLIEDNSNGKIYVVSNEDEDEIRYIGSASLFEGCGYSWGSVLDTPHYMVEAIYEEGDAVASGDCP